MDNNQFYDRFLKLKRNLINEKSAENSTHFCLDSATSDCPTAVRSECSKICVVPRDKVDLVIDMCHRGLANNPHVAHCSRNLTLQLVRTFFYWEGQAADVERRLQQCETCKRSSRAAQDKEPPSYSKWESRTSPLRQEFLYKPALYGYELAACLKDTELARSGFNYDKALKFIHKIRVRVERLKRFRAHVLPDQAEKELVEYVAFFKGLTINVEALRSDRSRLYGECGLVSKCEDRYQQLLQTLKTTPVAKPPKEKKKRQPKNMKKPPQETKPQTPKKRPAKGKAKAAQKTSEEAKFTNYLMEATARHGPGGFLYKRLLHTLTAWCHKTDDTMHTASPIDMTVLLVEQQPSIQKHEPWRTGIPNLIKHLCCLFVRHKHDDETVDPSVVARIDATPFNPNFEEYLLSLMTVPYKLEKAERIICAVRNYLTLWFCAPSCRAQLSSGLEAFSGFNIIEYNQMIHEAKLDLIIDQELKLFQQETDNFQVFKNMKATGWFVCVYGVNLPRRPNADGVRAIELVFYTAVHMGTKCVLLSFVDQVDEGECPLGSIYSTMQRDVFKTRIKPEDTIYFPSQNAFLMPFLWSLGYNNYEMIFDEYADLFIGHILDMLSLMLTNWDVDLWDLHSVQSILDDVRGIYSTFNNLRIVPNQCLPPRTLFDDLYRTDLEKFALMTGSSYMLADNVLFLYTNPMSM